MTPSARVTPPPGSKGSRRTAEKTRRRMALLPRQQASSSSSRIVSNRTDRNLVISKDDRMREARAVRMVLWICVLVCVLLSSSILAFQSWAFLAGDKGETTVPNINGLLYTQAALSVENAGLNLQIRNQIYSDNIGIDRIVEQIPVAGCKVKAGRDVQVDVSLGSRNLKTPNVIGLDRGEATKALDALGVNNRITTQSSDVAKAGTVINQSPPPGSPIAIGEYVSLVVSTGPLNKAFEMPNLIGMPYSDALSIIKENRLVIRSIRRTYPPGTNDVVVSDQIPISGTRITPGSEVLLTLKCPVSMESLGQRFAKISVFVPESAGTVEVRIVVTDRYETKLAYSGNHTGPTTVEQLITSWGHTTVKIYFDNKIIREEVY